MSRRTKKGDIVQVAPDHKWCGCLVVVIELKSFGVQGFVPMPGGGEAHIRLRHSDYEDTGGRVVFERADEA
jgi:hypothetical protein